MSEHVVSLVSLLLPMSGRFAELLFAVVTAVTVGLIALRMTARLRSQRPLLVPVSRANAVAAVRPVVPLQRREGTDQIPARKTS
jgi:hypothetical protein